MRRWEFLSFLGGAASMRLHAQKGERKVMGRARVMRANSGDRQE
jgi:hypothetical protein